MSLKYLFGPVSRAFAEHTLSAVRQTGACMAFNAAGDVDLKISITDSWEDVKSRQTCQPGSDLTFVVRFECVLKLPSAKPER